MTNPSALLANLQHGDSFFPSGGFAFSWGLETLRADGAIATKDDVARFIDGQLRYRWASCDRPAVTIAHGAGEDVARVRALDMELEALSLPAELRDGSSRAGRALLGVHAQLGTPLAGEYREHVLAGTVPGHLAAMQGMLWRSSGLPVGDACAVSAHALSVGLIGAALRLNLIGHIDGQRILDGLRTVIVELLDSPVPALDELRAYTPAADIAMMRHAKQFTRLFAN